LLYRQFGSTQLELSLVGLGCNNFGRRIDCATSERVVRRALDLGINHFDVADIYGEGKAEEYLGRALGSNRQQIVLASKFGLSTAGTGESTKSRGSRGYVTSAVEASLRRLGTDCIDLLYMHAPDRSTPIEETLEALEQLCNAGKVRHIGASNFRVAELVAAAGAAERLGVEGFVGCQDQWSLLNRKIEKTKLPRMKRLGLGLVPYLPLAGGALTGKYRAGAAMPVGARHTNDESGAERFLNPHWRRIERLRDYAEANGRTLLELAMSWLARQPLVVSIVTGATTPEQIEANVGSTVWTMTDADLAKINRVTARAWWRWRR
jgi:aryl-alcohol dehydrogenase-like predicted oxidoreductase